MQYAIEQMNHRLLFIGEEIDETGDGETSSARLKLKPHISASRLSEHVKCGQIWQTSIVCVYKTTKKCYSVCLKCWQRCQTQVIRITIEVQCFEAHMLTARTQFWKTMYWRVFGFTFWQQAQCLFEHLKSWQNCQVIHISFNIKACIRIHVLIHMCWEAPENNVLKSIWLLINTTTSKNVCLNICIGLNHIRLKSLVLALANVLEFMC